MDIQQIDKNFDIPLTIKEPDIIWYNVRELPFSIHGISYDSDNHDFVRMPRTVAKSVSPEVAVLSLRTAGGRVRFVTDSSYIAIRPIMNPTAIMSHMPLTGRSGFDLYRMFDGRERYFSTFVPPTSWTDGYVSGTPTYGELCEYTINFPLYDCVKELYVGLKKGAQLRAPSPYRVSTPIVYYGSSITQGACASRPGNCYQNIITRRHSADYINLGFSGAGRGEPAMADYVAGLDMCMLVMDYDSNARNVKELRDTHYPFYKTVRDRHPDIPIIFISHIDAYHEVYYTTKVNKERWGSFEERRNIIKATFDKAKADGDSNVYFIDGRDIFMGEEWDSCTTDGCHPNDLGFHRFALCLEKVIGPLLK